MKRRLVLAVVLAVIGVAAVFAGTAQAWGNGTICYQGTTYTFPDEPSYYTFLYTHTGAVEGTCKETPPSTSTATTSPPSTSTTPASTSSPTTAPSPTTSVSATSVDSVPLSTPSSEIVQPGAMCQDGCTETMSSTNSDATTSTPTPAGSPMAATSPSSTPDVPSSTPSTLPVTGSTTSGIAWAAAGCIALGLTCLALRRRA